MINVSKNKKITSLKKNTSFLKKKIQNGIIHIQSTRNNTIITLTDQKGNTKSWVSSGVIGFRNARKSTTYAAQVAAEKIATIALKLGFSSISVKMKGIGQGKENSVRALYKSGLIITKVEDRTSIPHNGCRSPKRRRI